MLLYTDMQAKTGKSTTNLIMRAFLRFVKYPPSITVATCRAW